MPYVYLNHTKVQIHQFVKNSHSHLDRLTCSKFNTFVLLVLNQSEFSLQGKHQNIKASWEEKKQQMCALRAGAAMHLVLCIFAHSEPLQQHASMATQFRRHAR